MIETMLHRFDRWLYAEGRPNRLAQALNGLSARIGMAGLGPRGLQTLEVEGRRSGRPIRFPVVVADLDGERYLVAMLGEGANWVANVRAAHGRAALYRGSREPVELTEVAPTDRAPILQRYVKLAPGARAHIPVPPGAPLSDFVRIADRYPVFRIRTRTGSSVGLAEQFPGKYLSLTSFRRDGSRAATPVWFVAHDGQLLVQTDEGSFKVRRIRRNSSVTVAPCTVRGRLRGTPVPARAEFLPADQGAQAQTLIARKYARDIAVIRAVWWVRARLRLGRPRGDMTYIAITPLTGA
jgi:PPOX class probable F420-dependent enzyme